MKMKSMMQLVESYLLREKDEDVNQTPGLPQPTSTPKRSDSLDSQVDHFLVSYEKEARNLKKEGFDFRTITRRVLSEAEDEGDDKKSSDSGDDESTSEVTKMSVDDIDIEGFAQSVVRLIDNYDSLLEIRDTLVSRASNFLKKNYDTQVISTFENTLRDKFDIEPGVSEVDKKYDIEVPNAERAGPSPGG